MSHQRADTVVPILLGVIFLALGLSARAEAHVPRITTPVVDNAAILNQTETDRLAERLIALRQQTGVQMAILLVSSTGGEPIEDYSIQVAEKWRGGTDERDDGVLLVLAINDRRSRLEVGYGLEAEITDARAAQILDAMRPALQDGRYFEALSQAVDDVATAADGQDPYPYPPAIILFLLGLALGAGLGLGERQLVEKAGMLSRSGASVVFCIVTGAAGLVAVILYSGWPFYLLPLLAISFPAAAVYFILVGRPHLATGIASVGAALVLTAVAWFLEQSGLSLAQYIEYGTGLIIATALFAGLMATIRRQHTVSQTLDSESWTWPEDKDPGITDADRNAAVYDKWGSAPEYQKKQQSRSSWSSSSSWGSSSSSSSSSFWGGGGGGFGGGGASGSW